MTDLICGSGDNHEKQLKVYEIKGPETDWFTGYNLLTALGNYLSTTDMCLGDFSDDDEIREVPESEWHQIRYSDDEIGTKKSISDYMKSAKRPDIICSTAY